MNDTPSADLYLEHFLPFRLNRLAGMVSRQLAEACQERFGIDVPQWRIIATAGPTRSFAAQFIADSTRMYKTRVRDALRAGLH